METKVRETLRKLPEQKTVRALVENFREELTGGTKILLSEAFNLAMQKPRKRIPGQKMLAWKREAFKDFADFMTATYPDADNIAAVLPKHAEAYISRLRTQGRFNSMVTYQRKGKTMLRTGTGSISNKTINDIQMLCHEIFALLSHDAGLIDNPFSMPKLQSDTCHRR